MPNRSELSETYDRLMSLVGQLLGLNEEERGFVLDRVAPLPEPEAQPKKSTKKAGKKAASKSQRGQSIADAIQRTGKVTNGACAYLLDNGTVCNTGDNNPIHDKSMGYAAYHEFQPGKSSAQSAARPSSTNGGEGSAEPEQEQEKAISA
jgi:hypothetical protein